LVGEAQDQCHGDRTYTEAETYPECRRSPFEGRNYAADARTEQHRKGEHVHATIVLTDTARFDSGTEAGIGDRTWAASGTTPRLALNVGTASRQVMSTFTLPRCLTNVDAFDVAHDRR
jgi:hypothetical protein